MVSLRHLPRQYPQRTNKPVRSRGSEYEQRGTEGSPPYLPSFGLKGVTVRAERNMESKHERPGSVEVLA